MVKRKSKGVVDSSDNLYSESEASDMDSEMLNLAKKRKNSISNSKAHSAVDSESDNETAPERLTTTNKKRSKRANLDSEPEEGELTDTDSSDDSQEEFNDGYADDLMGDDEDRRRLSLMTEKEREQEIFKRIETRELLMKRFNIEKKLRLQAKKEELKKQNYSKPSLDLKERVLERKKTAEENRGRSSDKKFQAMNLLKARREVKREREAKEKQMKIEQERQKKEHAMNLEINAEMPSRGHKTKLKASDVYSDDSGSSSEEDNADLHSSKASKKEQPAVSSSSSSSSDSDTNEQTRSNRLQYVCTREQLNTIRLSRDKLEKLVNLPFFQKVVTGCFVRIMIGMNESKPVYRICEISDVCETGKLYSLGSAKTNKNLRLRHGTQERVFRMEFVSNQEFTNQEFAKWKEMCETQGISVPTVDEFDNKVKEIKDAMDYELKEEDVEKMVKEKERFKTTPYNYAMKKTQLMKERDMAQSMGETEKMMELQDQLIQLEVRANELDRLRTSSISSISYINNRNRRKNIEEAEKAILAELRATKGQRVDDPFTRRHTKPSMMIKAKRPEEKLNATESAADESAASENSNEAKKANPQKHGEDMYAAHDFEIKFDFDVPSSVMPLVAPVPVIQVPSANKSRSLNLEDYKRRKGFI